MYKPEDLSDKSEGHSVEMRNTQERREEPSDSVMHNKATGPEKEAGHLSALSSGTIVTQTAY